jgi:hypothetical protein
MYLRYLAAAAAAFSFVFSASVQAKPWVYWEESSSSRSDDDGDKPSRRRAARASLSSDDEDSRPARSRATRVSHRSSSDDGDSVGNRSGLGPRPGAWCGWYMRSRHGGGPEFNLAANWRRWGSAGSPQIGAIVVWDHHVGEIVGRADNGQWIVLSGNDGGAVRRRARSISGATIRV